MCSKGRIRCFSLALVTALVLSSAVSGFNGGIDPLFFTGPGFDNDVLDISVSADGKQLVVGKFDSPIGATWRRIARIMPDGALDPSFRPGSGANGDINSVQVCPDGKILIGGAFTSYDGYSANRVARLNSDGSFDPTFQAGSGASGTVFAVVRYADGRLLVGGLFSTFNSIPARGLVRLNDDGSIDQTFTAPTSISLTSGILAVAIQGTKILVGGGFATPISTRGIARLNSDGSLDASFTASANFGSVVRSIVVQGASIYVAGDFSTMSGVGRSAVARLSSNGGVDASFIPVSPINNAFDIALQSDGKLICAGNGTVARLNSNGSADPGFVFSPGTNRAVTSLVVLPNEQILIGGRLFAGATSNGGANPPGVQRLNPDGSRDNNYLTPSGAAEFYVTKMCFKSNGKVPIIGPFVSVGGIPRNGFAQLNADGSLDYSFDPGIRPSAVAAQTDGKLVVGGVQSGTTYYFRRLAEDGSIDPTFSADSGGSSTGSSNVDDLAIQSDGKIVAVGSFTSINGTPRKGIVRLNPDGSIDATYNPNVVGASARVRRVVLLPDGRALVAGLFASGQGSSNVVFRLDSNGIADAAFSFTQPNNTILDISVDRTGRIMICGTFTNVNGFVARFVARLNANGGVDPTFVPASITGVGTVVRSVLAQPDGKILIGGEFLSVGGIPRTGFARLNSNGSLDTAFNHVLGGTSMPNLYTFLHQPDGKFIIGGYFTSVGSTIRNYISRFKYTLTTTIADFDGDGKTDISIFRPSLGEWWYLRSSDGGNATFQFGNAVSQTVPGDYTGDGKTDTAFWQADTGTWFILRSENFTYFSTQFGQNGDRPAPADFDGDGKFDPGVFRPGSGTWFLQNSATGTVTINSFGIASDLPTASDYDGDGKADLAIYRPSLGQWWIKKSRNNDVYALTFGIPADKPVQGDYTGDGLSDVAIWRPSTGEWFILRSEDSTYFSIPFGTSGDIPVPGDYDGDGKNDPAVFRPESSVWYINRSADGLLIAQFGAFGDRPVPSSFVPQ